MPYFIKRAFHYYCYSLRSLPILFLWLFVGAPGHPFDAALPLLIVRSVAVGLLLVAAAQEMGGVLCAVGLLDVGLTVALWLSHVILFRT